jgi:hypothetical protein
MLSWKSQEPAVTELFLERGDDYWQAGSGDAEFVFRAGSLRARLLVMGSEECGFHLLYDQEYGGRPRERIVSLGDGMLPNECNVLEVCGEPCLLPKPLFVSREKALACAEEFCSTGQPSDRIVWISESLVNWECREV